MREMISVQSQMTREVYEYVLRQQEEVTKMTKASLLILVLITILALVSFKRLRG